MSERIGPLLCKISDLAATGAKGACIQTPRGWVDIVVVKAGAELRAFENRCPHLSIPLEVVPDHFLDEDRETMVCRMHGARFRVVDGACISGPCHGSSLYSFEIDVSGDEVRLRNSDSA